MNGPNNPASMLQFGSMTQNSWFNNSSFLDPYLGEFQNSNSIQVFPSNSQGTGLASNTITTVKCPNPSEIATLKNISKGRAVLFDKAWSPVKESKRKSATKKLVLPAVNESVDSEESDSTTLASRNTRSVVKNKKSKFGKECPPGEGA